MSFYEDLQNELKNRLNAWFVANSLVFKAITMPDSESGMQELFAKYRDTPLVIVRYNESVFHETDSVNHVNQDEIVQMTFIIFSNKALGATGTLEAFENLNLCLLGYNPINCSKRLTFSKFVPVDWEGMGIFNTAYMNTERPVIQLDDEEIIFGQQFKSLTINE